MAAFATGIIGTVAPGGVITWNWHAQGYADIGVLVLMAHPYNPGGRLDVIMQRKENVPGFGFRYGLTFKNTGTQSTNWALEGGGVV